MPNWCNNSIIVKGAAAELKRFDEHFGRKHTSFSGGTMYNSGNDDEFEVKEDWISFKIHDTFTGKACTYINEITEEEGYSFTNFVPMTEQDFLNGWRGWSSNNWGTKWDVTPDEVYVSGMDLVEDSLEKNEPDDEIEVVYNFYTAWSPCEPVVLAMSKAFPALSFTHEYDEPGMGFAGIVEYYGGEEIDRKEVESADDYRRFVAEELGYDNYVKCPKCNEYTEDYELDEYNGVCEDCSDENNE